MAFFSLESSHQLHGSPTAQFSFPPFLPNYPVKPGYLWLSLRQGNPSVTDIERKEGGKKGERSNGSSGEGASPLFQSLPELGGGALGGAVLEVEDCTQVGKRWVSKRRRFN